MEAEEQVVKEVAAGLVVAAKARCFKCQKTVEIVEAQEETMKNERRRVFGKCAECGGKVSQFIKQQKQD